MQTPNSIIRISVAGLLVFSLFGGAVAYGAISHDPAANSYVYAGEWGETPETYLGEHVAVNGIVVSTDPYILETNYGIDKTLRVTIDNAPTNIESGQELAVFGRLTDERTIAADRTSYRDQWEAQYMYLTSALGIGWVVRRITRYWTIDWFRLGLQPQSGTNQLDEETDDPHA
jgi:hypothetical protein